MAASMPMIITTTRSSMRVKPLLPFFLLRVWRSLNLKVGLLCGDTNGDSVSDFQLAIAGVYSLPVTNIVL